ncbi:hypothetical protein SAMN06309944_1782 [Micrococcales bacterium KH10]|nr:hypothetical protein SAMN06309944_1782 [Micrococcales bacterium KH10]
MATITIRGLPEETRKALKVRAANSNRSMEAEARAILESAVNPRRGLMAEWISGTESLRGDFELPARSVAREVDLS